MPKIQRTGPTLGIPSPGPAGTGISQVPITSGDSGAGDIIENTLNRVTDRVISDAVNNRRTDDNNHITTKQTEFKRYVQEFTVDELAKTGKQTEGSIDRYKAKVELFDKGTAGQNKYTVDNLNMFYNDINLSNESVLLEHRQKGRRQDSILTRQAQKDQGFVEIGNKPIPNTFFLELGAAIATIQADDTLSKELQQVEIDQTAFEYADHLLSTLIATQPTKAMEIIDLKVYNGFFKGEEGAQRLNDLRKFAIKQQKAIEKDAEDLEKQNIATLKRENKQAGTKIKDDWFTGFLTDKPPTRTEIAATDPEQVSPEEKKSWFDYITKPENFNRNDISVTNNEYNLIRTGERKLKDIKAIPFQISIAEASKMRNYAKQVQKEEWQPLNEQLKHTIQSGRDRILAGTGRLSKLRGHKGRAIQKANEFEQSLNTILRDRGLEEQQKLITVSSPDYIVEDLIQAHFVTKDEIKASEEELRASGLKRVVNDNGTKESATDYLGRINKQREARTQNIMLKSHGVSTEENLMVREFLKVNGITDPSVNQILSTHTYLKGMERL